MICKAEGCNNETLKENLCEKHYKRYKRTGILDVQRTEAKSISNCLVLDCSDKHMSLGMCQAHYQRYYHYGSPYKAKARKICSEEDCYKFHFEKGYCKSCLREKRKRGIEVEIREPIKLCGGKRSCIEPVHKLELCKAHYDEWIAIIEREKLNLNKSYFEKITEAKVDEQHAY